MDYNLIINFIHNNLIMSNGSVRKYSNSLFKEFPEYINYIMEYTKFLSPTAGLAQRIWHILNKIDIEFLCNKEGCQNTRIWNKQTSRYNIYCSKECNKTCQKRKEKFRLTNIDRYGDHPMRVESILVKLKNNLTEKYGVDSFSKTDEFKDKIKETSLIRFGVDNPMKSMEVRQRFIETNLEKYGVKYPIQNEDILNKRQQTLLDRYNVVSPTMIPEVRAKQETTLFNNYVVKNFKHTLYKNNQLEFLENKDYLLELLEDNSATSISKILDVDITTVINYLHKHGIHDKLKSFNRSLLEDKICKFLESNNINFETNRRDIIPPKEIDIFIPKYNLGIEINGVYWHSDLKVERDINGHYNKWLKCKDRNIRLLTFFDDEINNELKWNIIKSKLLYLTKTGKFIQIGARKCEIRDVDLLDERLFLDTNHIQGFLNNRDKSYGAYFCGRLLGIFSVKQRKDYLEIVRYSVDIQYTCPGLFSKFLKYVINELNFTGQLVSFSDNCHSDGTLYKSCGFNEVVILGPGYSYTYAGKPRENRQRYMKEKIRKKFNIPIDNLTEKELMKSQGYGRVYDCGKIKWIKEV